MSIIPLQIKFPQHSCAEKFSLEDVSLFLREKVGRCQFPKRHQRLVPVEWDDGFQTSSLPLQKLLPFDLGSGLIPGEFPFPGLARNASISQLEAILPQEPQTEPHLDHDDSDWLQVFQDIMFADDDDAAVFDEAAFPNSTSLPERAAEDKTARPPLPISTPSAPPSLKRKAPSIDDGQDSADRLTTKAALDCKKYRESVAIPRFLEKRKCRSWKRELSYPSRSKDAFQRPRINGRFGARAKPAEVPSLALVISASAANPFFLSAAPVSPLALDEIRGL